MSDYDVSYGGPNRTIKMDTPQPWPEPKSEDIQHKMERKYPAMIEQFQKIQENNYEIFLNKNHDYGVDNLTHGKSTCNNEDLNFVLQGLWFRMSDKMSRIKSNIFDKKEFIVDESLEDTFSDLSNYATIAQIMISGKWGR